MDPAHSAPRCLADLPRRQCLSGLGAALGMLLAGCASAPAPRAARHTPAEPPQESAPTNHATHAVRHDIALFALSLLDMPYTSGGRGPATGFDCSGLVSHVYQQAAQIRLSGNAAAMARALRSIDPQALQAGDLVFFNTLGPPFSHVGIFVGDGLFVHASNPRTGVRRDRLNHRYYARRFEAAKTWFG